MKIPQLSVFLENRSHSLLEPLQALATAGINLSGITLADSEQFGILRLVLRDWSRARDLLQSAGWAVRSCSMRQALASSAPMVAARAVIRSCS